MRIEKKDNLPQGMSYPLTPSILLDALAAAHIDLETCFTQHLTGALFVAHFWPPNRNVAYERMYITSSAVPAPQSHAARSFIERTVIPELVRWAQGILALPPNSTVRREKQLFVRELPPDIAGSRQE